MGNVTGMKKGGSASARADGCCIRGKTKAWDLAVVWAI
jgi:hypothetical protein